MISFCAVAAFSQKYDEIKNMLILPGGFAKAKQSFDKQSANEKFYTKPEGYLIKSTIYANMAFDTTKAAESEKNVDEAYNAFLEYKKADPTMKLVEASDPVYKNTPYILYAAYYNSGVNNINAKNYPLAFEQFEKTVDLSDLLINRKIAEFAFDTNAVYYAGILAETVQKQDEAIKYYTRFADQKIVGKDYEAVYQSLVRYYAVKNDQENFEKYRLLGKELYPQSEYFTYNLLDFALGTSTDLNQKISNLEKILASNPNDYATQLALAEAIYDTLNSLKEGAVLPANADELETKMLNALNKCNEINPDEIQPTLLFVGHYLGKQEKLNEDMRAAEREVIKTESEVIKKGAKATADIKKKFADTKKNFADTKATHDAVYEQAKENMLKVVDKYSKKPNLTPQEKRSYYNIVGYLAEYYSYKREGAKGAELTKIVAEETKYNKLYDELKK
jgi:hypothetical protein